MDPFVVFVIFGLAYCVVDIIFAVVRHRCALPGLKCRACRGEK